MPRLSATIFTDQGCEDPGLECFDNVVRLVDPSFGFLDKIEAILRSPYNETVFLDTDCLVLNAFDEVFGLLNTFEIMFVPEFVCYNSIEGVPECFREINTGFLVYRKTEATRSLFLSWKQIYEAHLASVYAGNVKLHHDQPSFRSALLETNPKFYLLPYSYNFRPIYPLAVKGPIKILHYRGELTTFFGSALENADVCNYCDALRPTGRAFLAAVVARALRIVFRFNSGLSLRLQGILGPKFGTAKKGKKRDSEGD